MGIVEQRLKAVMFDQQKILELAREDELRKGTKSKHLARLNMVLAGITSREEFYRKNMYPIDFDLGKIRALRNRVVYKKYRLTAEDMIWLNLVWQEYHCAKTQTLVNQ